MITLLGAWNEGSLGSFSAPYFTIKLDESESPFSFFSEGQFVHPFGQIPVDQPDQPIPVEPDGGIGDGAGPLDELLPVEPDGGIGDGAGPIPQEPDGAAGEDAGPTDGPIPVEPDGGIGDGAGPIPQEPDGAAGEDAGPIPVEPDGGIGDGAGPLPDGDDGVISIPENNIDGGGTGTSGNDFFYATEESDTFVFQAEHGNDTITGFDVAEDVLDLSATLIDFTDIESLTEQTKESIAEDGTVYGVLIHTGDGNDIYIDGVSIADFASMTIEF